MTVLDCENFDTALTSVANAIDVPAAALLTVLRRYDPASRTGVDRLEIDAPALLRPFGIALREVRFSGAYYFHGTRVAQPESFLRDGILSLGAMLDRIWAALHELCAEQIPHQQWVALRHRLETGTLGPDDDRHWAWLYRHKYAEPVEHGPFASLVRDMVLRPAEGHHDYLSIPEIVRDIAVCVGNDLQARFEASTTSCVVKFRHNEVNEHTVGVALMYLLASVRNEPLDDGCVYYLSCAGTAVAPHDVVAVDEIGWPERAGTRRTTVRRHHPQPAAPHGSR